MKSTIQLDVDSEVAEKKIKNFVEYGKKKGRELAGTPNAPFARLKLALNQTALKDELTKARQMLGQANLTAAIKPTFTQTAINNSLRDLRAELKKRDFLKIHATIVPKHLTADLKKIQAELNNRPLIIKTRLGSPDGPSSGAAAVATQVHAINRPLRSTAEIKQIEKKNREWKNFDAHFFSGISGMGAFDFTKEIDSKIFKYMSERLKVMQRALKQATGTRGIAEVNFDTDPDKPIGSYTPFHREMSFHPAQIKSHLQDPVTPLSKQAEFSSDYFSGRQRLQAIMDHEFFHSLVDLMPNKSGGRGIGNELEALFEKRQFKSGDAIAPTDYALNSAHDWGAENYALWQAGVKDKVDKSLYPWFEALDKSTKNLVQKSAKVFNNPENTLEMRIDRNRCACGRFMVRGASRCSACQSKKDAASLQANQERWDGDAQDRAFDKEFNKRDTWNASAKDKALKETAKKTNADILAAMQSQNKAFEEDKTANVVRAQAIRDKAIRDTAEKEAYARKAEMDNIVRWNKEWDKLVIARQKTNKTVQERELANINRVKEGLESQIAQTQKYISIREKLGLVNKGATTAIKETATATDVQAQSLKKVSRESINYQAQLEGIQRELESVMQKSKRYSDKNAKGPLSAEESKQYDILTNKMWDLENAKTKLKSADQKAQMASKAAVKSTEKETVAIKNQAQWLERLQALRLTLNNIGTISKRSNTLEKLGIRTQADEEIEKLFGHGRTLATSKDPKAIKSAKDDIIKAEKATEKFKKQLNGTGKATGFMNSKFAKFSIIMSGIAATLFVAQSALRGLQAMVNVGRELEESMAGFRIELGLTADESTRVEKALRGASVATGAKYSDTTEAFNALIDRGLPVDAAKAGVSTVVSYMKHPDFDAARSAQVYDNDYLGEAEALGRYVKELASGVGGAADRVGSSFQELLRTFMDNYAQELITGLNALATVMKVIADAIPGGKPQTMVEEALYGKNNNSQETAKETRKIEIATNHPYSPQAYSKATESSTEIVKGIIKFLSEPNPSPYSLTAPGQGQELPAKTEISEPIVQRFPVPVDPAAENKKQEEAFYTNKIAAYKKVYDTLGLMNKAYYTSLTEDFEKYNKQEAAEIDKAFGKGTAAKMRQYAKDKADRMQHESDILSKIEGYDKQELAKDKKLYSAKKIITNKYYAYQQEQIKKAHADRAGRVDQSTNDALLAQEQLVLDKNKFEYKKALYKQYYDATGIMDDEWVAEQRKNAKAEYNAILREYNDLTIAKRILEKRLQAIDDSATKAKLNTHQDVASATGQISDFLYQQQKDNLQNDYNDYKAYGVDIILLEEWKAQKTLEIEKKLLKNRRATWSHGADVAVQEMKLAYRSMGEIAYDFYSNLGDSMESGFKDPLVAALTDAEYDFKNFCEGMKQTFAKMLTELAYEALMRPIVVSVVQGASQVLGGSGTTSQTNASNSLLGGLNLGDASTAYGMITSNTAATTGYSLGMSMPSINSGYAFPQIGLDGTPVMTSVPYSGTGLTSVLEAVSPYMGAFALGSMGYSTIGNMIGLPQGEYSGIGAGTGAAGGLYLGTQIGSIGGPIGAIIGSVAGGLIGSLFGGSKSQKAMLSGDQYNSNPATFEWGLGGFSMSKGWEDIEGRFRDEAAPIVEEISTTLADSTDSYLNNLLDVLPEKYAATLQSSLNDMGTIDMANFEGNNGDGLWAINGKRLEETVKTFTTRLSEVIWENISGPVESAVSAYIIDTVNALDPSSVFKADSAIMSSINNSGLFNADWSKAEDADFEDYFEGGTMLIDALESVNTILNAMTDTVSSALNPLTEYQQEVLNINTQFDSWKYALESIGVAEEHLIKLETQRAEVLKASATAYRESIQDLQTNVISTFNDDINMQVIADRYSPANGPEMTVDHLLNRKDVFEMVYLSTTNERVNGGMQTGMDAIAAQQSILTGNTITPEQLAEDLKFLISVFNELDSRALNVANSFKAMSTELDKTIYMSVPGASESTYYLDQINTMAKSSDQLSLDEVEEYTSLVQGWYTAAITEAQETANVWEQVATTTKDLISQIEDTISSIKYSSLNVSLPSEKFEDASKDYSDLYNRAASGDQEAIQDYLSFASTYLQQAQDKYKSSYAYQGIYNSVMDDMNQIKSMVSSTDYQQKLYDEVVTQGKESQASYTAITAALIEMTAYAGNQLAGIESLELNSEGWAGVISETVVDLGNSMVDSLGADIANFLYDVDEFVKVDMAETLTAFSLLGVDIKQEIVDGLVGFDGMDKTIQELIDAGFNDEHSGLQALITAGLITPASTLSDVTTKAMNALSSENTGFKALIDNGLFGFQSFLDTTLTPTINNLTTNLNPLLEADLIDLSVLGEGLHPDVEKTITNFGTDINSAFVRGIAALDSNLETELTEGMFGTSDYLSYELETGVNGTSAYLSKDLENGMFGTSDYLSYELETGADGTGAYLSTNLTTGISGTGAYLSGLLQTGIDGTNTYLANELTGENGIGSTLNTDLTNGISGVGDALYDNLTNAISEIDWTILNPGSTGTGSTLPAGTWAPADMTYDVNQEPWNPISTQDVMSHIIKEYRNSDYLKNTFPTWTDTDISSVDWKGLYSDFFNADSLQSQSRMAMEFAASLEKTNQSMGWNMYGAQLLAAKELFGFSEGGIVSGPTSGFPVILHGTEKITPLSQGRDEEVENQRLIIENQRILIKQNQEIIALAKQNVAAAQQGKTVKAVISRSDFLRETDEVIRTRQQRRGNTNDFRSIS